MASNIDVTNIDTAYPVAGQDNDSQGFRDNFTNINQNFVEAKAEIEALQDVELIVASPPALAIGAIGDLKGKMAYDATYMYLCTDNYTTGVISIWIKTALVAW